MQTVISALLAPSLCWDSDAISRARPGAPRNRIADESMQWQQLSQHGSTAELWAHPLPGTRKLTRNGKQITLPSMKKVAPREDNRILELHGLMGAIGEQLALAWTTEQDVQRFVVTARGRAPEHQRLVQRALAESAAYFTLGAAHSLANLVLRLLLLNDQATITLNAKFKRANGFVPGSDDRGVWLTLNAALVSALTDAATASTNRFMIAAVASIERLQIGTAFADLDARRGMDYHRRRPQSVLHASPRKNVVTKAGNTRTMTMYAAGLEPEANADEVHRILVEAMTALYEAMRDIRSALPKALRAEKIAYL
jgi:hypothetical protein